MSELVHDPFEAPVAPTEAEPEHDAEELRRALLPREGAVRMAVTPFLLLGVLGVSMGLFGLVTRLAYAGASASTIAILCGMVVAGAAFLLLSKGLRDFRPWSRPPALVASGLLSVGAIALLAQSGRRPEPLYAALLMLSTMPLVLLSSRPSAFLFTPTYAEVRRATPHLEYRAPPAVVISIALFIALVALIVWWNVGGRVPLRA